MNKRLAAGLAIFLALLALSLLSGRIAPHEQGYTKSVTEKIVDGRKVLVMAPEAPGSHFAFGSDGWGRDLASEMLHGLPWTLAIVFVTGAFRCVIGLGAGLVMGSSGGAGRMAKKAGFSPLSAIPSFLIAAFILYPVTINPTMPSLGLFAFQAAVLIFVELAPVAASFASRTALILEQPFVEAVRAAGAGRRWILRYHVLPFIAADFVEALPVQALSVAAMVGKLGIVKLFIGGTVRNFSPIIETSARSEWLGLLGNYLDSMYTAPWLVLAPFAGWLLILTCTRLLAAGLKESLAGKKRLAVAV